MLTINEFPKDQQTNIKTCQCFFDTDIVELINKMEDDVEYTEQNHFGDLLVETIRFEGGSYRLWRNLDENVMQGEPLIEVEHNSKLSNWKWETLFSL